MHRRILVSIAALAVTSTVAALAVNTNMGSSVTEPVAEPVVQTAPGTTSASPSRAASPEPVVADLPYAPRSAAPCERMPVQRPLKKGKNFVCRASNKIRLG